jgi:repressor LexA
MTTAGERRNGVLGITRDPLESMQWLCYITAMSTADEGRFAEAKYTPQQGQYLAFIYYYTKIHGCAPAEADFERYFRVSWPSVHRMILTLEKRRLISRIPRDARSIRLLLPREKLPDLK